VSARSSTDEMSGTSILDAVCVVLLEPQDPINIGAVVRVMKNMGVRDLRLVNPVAYDPNRIEKVAHHTRDLVERIRHFDSLDAALADCVWVAGFSGRRRAARWPRTEPRAAAATALERAEEGTVALLFGREDDGLSAEALDRTHTVVTIPTTEHASLNLAQAVLVGLYELHLAAGDATRQRHGGNKPRKDAPPPTGEEWELFFGDTERALVAIDFLKTRNPEHVMRSIRSLLYRADPNSRELTLVRAVFIEVLRTIERERRQTEARVRAELGQGIGGPS
jgi:tRNA/rRNA methyltransferase/tRNA (cytidine32/uridine32-2'-O)-methyltransferase